MAASAQDDFQGVRRVVAVGDIHGDKDALAAVLNMVGLIDHQERWTGGGTHLVQIGDVPARGPQTRKAFDFLMRLETEAVQAGGRVHALIGNHDAGVMYGDLRNITPEEYGEFREPRSEDRVAQALEQEMEALKRAGRLPAASDRVEYLRKTWLERHPPGFVEHREAFSPNGIYGAWIRRNNAAIRINDTLFVHGGISPKYATRSRASLNLAIRQELAKPESLPPGVSTDPQGPLWYRGFTEEEESPELEAHLRRAMAFHGVRRIVLGHVVTKTAILPRFGGRVVNIDLGLSRFYGRPPACLLLESGAAEVLHRGKRIPLPGPRRDDLLEYLRSVEAADESPSPVHQLILDLTAND